jgi:uncharacterized protein YndB with AHSA1/START domain
MERKTAISAEDGQQELTITREFDLPVKLLFQAYVEPDIVEQWMGTKVLKLESKRHGSYQFETTDARGNKHRFHGVIHEFGANQKIIRTFEMEQMPFGIQLEFLTFDKLTADTSKLTMRIFYESAAQRDQMIKLGMAPGINLAHNRLQEVAGKLKGKGLND